MFEYLKIKLNDLIKQYKLISYDLLFIFQNLTSKSNIFCVKQFIKTKSYEHMFISWSSYTYYCSPVIIEKKDVSVSSIIIILLRCLPHKKKELYMDKVIFILNTHPVFKSQFSLIERKPTHPK